MVWNFFTITDKYKSSDDYIKFSLSGYVSYSNGSEKYIYCKNTGPFAGWKEDDRAAIDFEKTRQFDSSHLIRVLIVLKDKHNYKKN